MKMKTKMMMRHSEGAEIDVGEIRELRSLVRKGESEYLEFKRKATYPEKIVCEMLAFANTVGGTLLIGVSDDGTIPGVKFPEEEIFAVENALKKLARPAIKAKPSVIAIAPQRFVVKYNILRSSRKPHYLINIHGKGEGDVFIRHQDKTIRASTEVREILKRSNTKRNIQFRYGDHEALLMKFLMAHPRINLSQFQSLSGLSRHQASRILVVLVLANILQITPSDKGDWYSLKKHAL